MIDLLIASLYFDEDVDARLAEALRQRGYDVETTREVGLLGVSDQQQLIYAVSQNRALVTHNIKHFPGIHTAWLEKGQKHWGIIILTGQPEVGVWLRRMKNLLNHFSKEELRNCLLFLGAAFDSSP